MFLFVGYKEYSMAQDPTEIIAELTRRLENLEQSDSVQETARVLQTSKKQVSDEQALKRKHNAEQALEYAYQRSQEKKWGQFTPLGQVKDPALLVIQSNAEYQAVCLLRCARKQEEDERMKAKQKRAERQFGSIRKKDRTSKRRLQF